MPELGTLGSVRGDTSNGVPYRDDDQAATVEAPSYLPVALQTILDLPQFAVVPDATISVLDRHRQIQPRQLEQRIDQPFGLAQRLMEHCPQDQRRLDGEIRADRPTWSAAPPATLRPPPH